MCQKKYNNFFLLLLTENALLLQNLFFNLCSIITSMLKYQIIIFAIKENNTLWYSVSYTTY